MTGFDDRDRRAELVAAAVHGALDPADTAEFELLRLSDPAVDDEVRELRAAADRAATLGRWDASPPSASLRDRVLAIGDAAPAHLPTSARIPVDVPTSAEGEDAAVLPLRRRPRAVLGLTAAACLLVGAAVGGIVVGVAGTSSPPDGPPGTLGAVERVEFTGEPGGSEIAGSVVAHTWGTETVLRIDGLAPESTYSVVLIGTDGDRFDSGTFLGSTVSIDCRMNAAVLRQDVAIVEIEDAAGDVVASAELPDA